MPTPTPRDLHALARQREPEMIAFLQDLVRIPSVNGRDAEAAVAARIIEEARRLGLDAHLAALDPARPNAVVTWGSGPAGFALIGHMDTVAEGDLSQWTRPPFAAEIDGGRLVGRGAADNKAGIACGLYCVALLRDHGLLNPSEARVILAGVADEESGASSTLGVRYLLDTGVLAGARGAIYTYTSDIVCVGHRGLIRLKLAARGRSLHSGSPDWAQKRGGVNAVTGLAAVLLRLERLDLPYPDHPAFADLGFTITPGTVFHGGEWESMVPASAYAAVDVRLMPGQPARQVLDAVQQAIDAEVSARPGLHIDMAATINLPGAAISVDHPLVQTAQGWAQAITGREWPAAGAGPANEGYMLIGAGIPTLCGFGPTGGGAHAPDEWVDLASLPATVAIYAGLMADYLAGGR
jgi:acetylornithine deacetylase/succinyl-diaminopimelate desuccinylase-like protein